MLLLLTETYFPPDITSFLSGTSYSSFSFGFLPTFGLPLLKSIKEYFDEALDDDYLEALGMESANVVINNFSLLIVFAWNVVLHIAF